MSVNDYYQGSDDQIACSLLAEGDPGIFVITEGALFIDAEVLKEITPALKELGFNISPEKMFLCG